NGSQPDEVFTNVHYPSSQTTGGDSQVGQAAYNSGVDLTQGFHTYGVDWEPSQLTFYLDGNAIRTVTSNIPNVPMYIIINNQVHENPGNMVWPTTSVVSNVTVTQNNADDKVVSGDDLSDFSHLYSHSANLQILSDNPSQFATFGQPSTESTRVGLTSAAGADENVVYQVPSLQGFNADVYSDPSLEFNPPAFFTSPDGLSWTPQSISGLNDGVGVGWRHTSFNVTDLPPGTDFLKVQFPDLGPNYLATQLAKIFFVTANSDAQVAAGPMRFDDGSPAISYDGAGWAQYPDTNLYGGNQHYTIGENDSATISFTGTYVDFGYTRDNNRGQADVYLDGVYQTTVDFYSSTTQYSHLMYAASGLQYGPHTLTIVNNGVRDAASSGNFIGIDFCDIG
ncbi:MAG: glycoside hydrolase family 16 protein, partial [Propionibacteriaceae bacterium]|nr:glycoside hydrolase family 16 protein [Propionibacteriaceae bacterium]